GNMWLLEHSRNSGQQAGVGAGFAMRVLTAFTEPWPLWSRLQLGQRQHIDRLFAARPPGFAVTVLAITAVVLVLAAFWPASRRLASLAAVSLLAAATAVITISRIPASKGDLGRLSYLILVMFPAGVLIWLTLATALVLAARRLISGWQRPVGAAPPGERRRGIGRHLRTAVRAAAVPLILLASVPGLVQQSGRPAAGQDADQVGAAAALIERLLPTPAVISLAISVPHPDRYRILTGLNWALTSYGHPIDFTSRGPARPIPHVTVLIHDREIIVEIRKTATRNLVATVQSGGPEPTGGRRGVKSDL